MAKVALRKLWMEYSISVESAGLLELLIQSRCVYSSRSTPFQEWQFSQGDCSHRAVFTKSLFPESYSMPAHREKSTLYSNMFG